MARVMRRGGAPMRVAMLCGLGYRVLRLEAGLVMRDLLGAVALVRAAL